MERYFAWLVRHEKTVVAVTVVLILAFIVQMRIRRDRAEPEISRAVANQSLPSSDPRGDLAGTWEMSVSRKRGGTQTWTLTLEQNGEALTGVLTSEGGDLPVSGTVKGQSINLSAQRFGVTVNFPATFDGTIMKGNMRVLTINLPWTAKRR
jgi:hypothetical protein